MKKSLIVLAVLMLAGCGQAPAAPMMEAIGPESALDAASKTDREVKRFREADEDRSGGLSREEWLTYNLAPYVAALEQAKTQGNEKRVDHLEKEIPKRTKEMEKRFTVFDYDKDGAITLGEYYASERGQPVGNCEDGPYAKADTNEDGAVDRQEWVAVRTVMAEKSLEYARKDGKAAAIARAEKDLAREVKDAETIFKMIDMDKNAKLSCAEFALGTPRRNKY